MEKKNNKLYIDDYDSLVDKYIGAGCNGICYLTKDNKVLKILDDGKEESIEPLTALESDIFVFPKTLVYNIHSREFIGYIMDYVEGTMLSAINGGYDIDFYLNEVKKVENEVEILTDQNVVIFDAGCTNIMISNNGLRVVDTDFYEINKDKADIKYNFVNCASGLMYPIGANMIDPDFINEKLNYYCSLTSKGIMKPSTLINEIINELYMQDEACFKTIDDLAFSLRLIRR